MGTMIVHSAPNPLACQSQEVPLIDAVLSLFGLYQAKCQPAECF